MKITEALIERFFNNACDEAEQQAVKDHFTRHPEVLKQYMTESTWRAFEADQPLPEPISDKMLSVIRQQTYRGRRVIMMRWWWAAAAAVLVLSLGAYWLMHTDTATPAKTMAKATAPPQAPAPLFNKTSNITTKPLSIALEDGTQVKLAPQSELVYPVPFPRDRRDLTLKGQALFHVAKDATRPFTVYAGKLATTAIGTVFRITAFTGKTTSVHLLSGKVRVAADSNAHLAGINTTYLSPGQELLLDARQHLVVLNRKDKDKMHRPALMAFKQNDLPDTSVTVFRNEPLENIFTTLSEKYHIKIVFQAEQLSGMTFTGKYDDQKETLSSFIQTISLLNNLVMHEVSGEIIIEVQ